MAVIDPERQPRERRRVERLRVARRPKGRLQLYAEGKCLEVARILDISPFGMCVQLPCAIADDADVRVDYRRDGREAEGRGTVVWQKPVEEEADRDAPAGSHWLGVFFYPSHIDANVEFFRAVTAEETCD